ncbi:MAG TPA: PLP-dependent aminotransferase family protein [Acidobacteriaceae bacterium]|nr:PLP-dependent aminotransferase family protein [Acidobacteriaceae bacterium]
MAIPIARTGEPLFRQVYGRIRQGILSGTLRAGERLPSTRDLAEQLGISRTVVVAAYELLLAEGYATGRVGSGTFVAPEVGGNAGRRAGQRPGQGSGKRPATLRLSRYGNAARDAAGVVDAPRRQEPVARYDFANGRSDLATFPFAVWRRMLQRQAREASVRQFDYGSTLGSMALRRAICGHLRRARAVVGTAEDVIIVNGAQQALDLVARVLVERGDAVAIEDPHYNGAREAFRAAGARLCGVPVDRDGLDPSLLPDDARLAFVTPSHQFPTGAILPLERRLALLKWARRRNAVILEDDYDGEFRYDGRPLESLQGLDTDGRIVYLGTFSRTVFPSLRIGYLVAPPSLMPTLAAAKWLSDLHSSTLEQETLAEFIESGLYERHLRRLRRRNTQRRAALLDAIGKHLGDRVEVTGDGAGAQVMLWPKAQVSEAGVIRKAARLGVGIYSSGHCYLDGRKGERRPGFVLGYATLNEREIREGIRLLGTVL